MKHKRFVEVDVRFSTEGKLRPLQILFDAEHIYEIDLAAGTRSLIARAPLLYWKRCNYIYIKLRCFNNHFPSTMFETFAVNLQHSLRAFHCLPHAAGVLLLVQNQTTH